MSAATDRLNAWKTLVGNAQTQFAGVAVPTEFWNDLKTAVPKKAWTGSDELNMVKHLRDKIAPHAAAEGKAEMLERLLGSHTERAVGKMEATLAEEMRRDGLTHMERWGENVSWAKAGIAEHTGMNAVKNSVHTGGKMLLIGGAAAAGIAVLAGMFGGKKKEAEAEEMQPQQQAANLPTPEMMMMTAPPQQSRAIMPSGNMPGSEVNISELLANKGGPQYAMGV